MAELVWEKDAEKELKRVPFFIRSFVRKKVEERVEKFQGKSVVCLADFKEAEVHFRSVRGDKSESELRAMMPVENQPGVKMVIIETCHNKLSNCPNVLIDTDEWRKALEDWARENDISERIRARIKNDKIYYHHKFRISISGCPNACSRPQICEVGIVGTIKPELYPDDCTFCGKCEKACPDLAIRVDNCPPVFDFSACLGCKKCFEACRNWCIKLSKPRAKLLMGGKLGRHPHLGQIVAEVSTPLDLLSIIDSALNTYLENGREDERFSDFWIRNFKT